jgi:hypothetical protein
LLNSQCASILYTWKLWESGLVAGMSWTIQLLAAKVVESWATWSFLSFLSVQEG